MAKPPLQIIQGGLVEDEVIPITKTAGAPPKGPDWLLNLPHQARFICKRKGTVGSSLDQYGVCAILPSQIWSPVLIYDFQVAMGSPFRWVLSDKFSLENDLVAILPSPPYPHEEDNNEQHHLSLPEPREEHDDA